MHGVFIPPTHRVHVLGSLNRLILLFLINCGNDSVSTGCQLIGRETTLLGKFRTDLLHKITGRAFHCRSAQSIGINGLWEFSCVRIGLRNPPVFDHQIDDTSPPRARFLFINCRVPRGRSGNDSGNHCGLGKGEIFCLVTEVSLGCGLNSVGSTPEVNSVEVVTDDLVFGLFSVDLEGKNCFLGLTHITGRFPNVVALNILLGQGRCTLARPAPNIVD